MTDPDEARRVAMGLFAVDDRGLFCRHCGRSSWRHYRRDGALHCAHLERTEDD